MLKVSRGLGGEFSRASGWQSAATSRLTRSSWRANLREQFLRANQIGTPGGRLQSAELLPGVLSLWSGQSDVSSASGTLQGASDWALVQRLVARDESALAVLYDRYSGLVCAVVTRILRDAGGAEEVLQDIFFQLWRNASHFDPARGSLPGWLLVTARNRAISKLRRRRPGDATDDTELEADSIALPFSLESAAEQKQLLGKVKGAMGDLPSPQRQAVELAYFEGMTHSEIAEQTGEPLGTVKTRLRSAVESLKQKLNA